MNVGFGLYGVEDLPTPLVRGGMGGPSRLGLIGGCPAESGQVLLEPLPGLGSDGRIVEIQEFQLDQTFQDRHRSVRDGRSRQP